MKDPLATLLHGVQGHAEEARQSKASRPRPADGKCSAGGTCCRWRTHLKRRLPQVHATGACAAGAVWQWCSMCRAAAARWSRSRQQQRGCLLAGMDAARHGPWHRGSVQGGSRRSGGSSRSSSSQQQQAAQRGIDRASWLMHSGSCCTLSRHHLVLQM